MKSPHLQSVILKVASRCNLNCTYCYMYNLEDKSFRDQPRVMSSQTVVEAFEWIERQIRRWSLPHFHVSLHGGEPLLAGQDLIRTIATHSREVAARTGASIGLSLLSNGTLLNEDWIEFLLAQKIRFGLSLDGPAEYHDRFRLTPAGGATHHQVESWARRILENPRWRAGFSSVLCVLHPDMDGTKLVRYFHDLGLPGADLLLPDQNWLHGAKCYPPPNSAVSYGRVLADAYLEWRRIDNPRFHIRKFGLFVNAMLGQTPALDSVGTGPITVFTIETSGEVEPVDSLKVCGNGFTKTGLMVRDATPEAIENLTLIQQGLRKGLHLPAACCACRAVALCGGGYLPHRFNGTSFDSPTVYCLDMLYIADLSYLDVAVQLRLASASWDPSEGAFVLGDLIDALRRFGAEGEQHTDRQLIHHLVGTASILARAGESLTVVKAGLFHAIYGTRTFSRVDVPTREAVQSAIGSMAEALVWAYAADARGDTGALPSIGSGETDVFASGLAALRNANRAEQDASALAAAVPRLRREHSLA